MECRFSGHRSEHLKRPPEKFFVFDSAKLMAGDVLLSTVPHSATSAVIRSVTSSKFSHAALCTDPPGFIEAVGIGTRPFTIARVAVLDPRWVRVLRLAADVANSAAIARAAGREAQKYLLAKYWVAGALAAGIRAIAQPSARSVFCSHLVAQAYRAAGLDLCPKVKPTRVTPAALDRSPYLEDVTGEVLHEVRRNDWPVEPDFTERGIDSVKINEEIQIRHRVADRMRAAIEAVGRTDLLRPSRLRAYGVVSLDETNDFHKYLACLICANRDETSTGRQMDEAYVAAIKEEGYLSIPDLLFNEHSLYLDRIVAAQIEAGAWSPAKMKNAVSMYRTMKRDVIGQLREFRSFTTVYQQCYTATNLNTFRLLDATHGALVPYGERLSEVLSRLIARLEEALHETS
jgi:hypothetical protein